jgi:hypothetical protein
MKGHRALEDTVERARHYRAMARDALERFPAPPWKHALRDAARIRHQPGVLKRRDAALSKNLSAGCESSM